MRTEPVSRRTLLPLRVYRAARTIVHLLEGLATTTLVFPLLAPARRRRVVRRWCVRLLRMLNVDARVQGRLVAHEGNVLLVANHISWLDIFVLNAQQPVRFIAKAEVARWPVVGWLVRGVGTLFVERTRRRDIRRVNAAVAVALASGDVLVVFPEGTTTDGTKLLPFHGSLLQPIIEAKGHVQPVALRYRGPSGELSVAPAYVGDDSFMASFWRVTGARSLVVELLAQPPLAARARHRRELARSAETAIRAALGLQVAATGPDTAAGPRDGSP